MAAASGVPTSDLVTPQNDLDLGSLTSAAAARVKAHMEQNDGSHDWWHIHRVRGTARKIAAEEGLSAEQVIVVDLAALLHDVEDWKYAHVGAGETLKVKGLLEELRAPEALVSQVLGIIDAIGFKEELGSASASATAASSTSDATGGAGAGSVSAPHLSTNGAANGVSGAAGNVSLDASGSQERGSLRRQLSIEAQVVQDADRLDAIGAIGIARCFTFGGRFSRALYDPDVPPRDKLSKEDYMASGAKQHTINHFYEKLLKLKGMMKTESGKTLAEQRHQFMEQYLEQFFSEWNSLA